MDDQVSTDLGATSTSGSPSSGTAQAAQQAAGQTAGAVAQEGKAVASTAAEQAASVVGDVREQALSVAEEARTQAQRVFGDASTEFRSQAEQRLSDASRTARSTAGELRALAEGRTDEAGRTGELAARASDQLERLAGRVDELGWQGVADEVADFGRRRPLVFLAGAAAAGFLAARVLKNAKAASSGPDAADSLRPELVSRTGVAQTPGLPVGGTPPYAGGSVADPLAADPLGDVAVPGAPTGTTIIAPAGGALGGDMTPGAEETMPGTGPVSSPGGLG
jgi:vacuolar-type H+-ATPase subunit H